ncbi:MAG: hypothetical protein ACOYVK_02740 [Bacillota bacterium]
MDDMIVIPVYHYVEKLMIKEHVKNIKMVGMGHWWLGFGDIQK